MPKSPLYINYVKSLSIFLLLFLISFTSIGQVRFYSSVDAQKVFKGSYIEVNFILENEDGNNFTPPDFQGFSIVSGPNTSSSYSMINGVSSTKKTYSYTLLAKKTGKFIIAPATIWVNGKKLITNPIEITVIKQMNTDKEDDNKDIFATMELSDSIAYPGQQIIIQYKLFTKKNISNYSFRSEPDLSDFRVIELNNDTRGKRQIVNNSEYTVFTLKKLAIFPQKTGNYHLDGANIILQLPDKRSRNVFFRSTKPYPIYTRDKNLKIIPLPPNAPQNFSGNTGRFKLFIKTDKKRVSTDNAVSLKLQIQSDYPSKFIEAPKIKEYLRNFEIYDPKVLGQKDYEEEGYLKSKKTFEYLLVPQKPGTYKIQIPYIYFDVDSAKYTTVFSNIIRLNVIKGKKINNKKAILSKYRLSPPMVIKNLKKKKNHFFNSKVYWIILLLALFSIPLMYFYRNFLIKKSNIDPIILKRKKASKMALMRLINAKKYMDENKSEQFYKEISISLLKYIADKLNIPMIELSKENIKSKLGQLNISSENINKFMELINECELALYAGNPEKDMETVFRKTRKLISDIEGSM